MRRFLFDIPHYDDKQGIVGEWDAEAVASFELGPDGAVLAGNALGLELLARNILALAAEGTPSGSHSDLGPWLEFQPGSRVLTIVRLGEEGSGKQGWQRSPVELAKDWRSDRNLRRLEALLVVADLEHSCLLSGNGELIEPDDGIVAVSSGGNHALAAARVLMPDAALSAHEVVERR